MNWRVILPLVLLAGVVAAVAIAWPQAQNAWPQLDHIGPGTWVAAAGGMAFSYFLRAMRVRAEWRGRYDLPALQCLQITLVHSAAINVLPMRAGELGYPLMLKRRWNVPLADAATSLVWMRLQDVVVLAFLAFTALLLALARQDRIGTATAAAGIGIALVLLLLFVTQVARVGAALLAMWHRSPRRGRLHPKVDKVLETVLGATLRGTARASAPTWGWCASNWVVKLVTLASLLAVLAKLPWIQAWTGVVGGEVAAALPVQPQSGFGTYEAGVALAGTFGGHSSWPKLLAAAFIVHLVVLGTSVVGAGLAWVLIRRPAAAEPPVADDAAAGR